MTLHRPVGHHRCGDVPRPGRGHPAIAVVLATTAVLASFIAACTLPGQTRARRPTVSRPGFPGVRGGA
jgi:hypothetical protein